MKGYLLWLLMLLPFVALACTTDDEDQEPTPPTPGPAAVDLGGVWEGSFTSERTVREGALCMEIEQDGTSLSGQLFLDDSRPLGISGRVNDSSVILIWGPGSPEEAAGDVPPEEIEEQRGAGFDVSQGGSLAGEVEGESISGSWAGLELDQGPWSATRSGADRCPGA